MSFTINAGTLFVGALLFLLAVFVKPLVMVLRDKAVWWWIEKYIINDQLKRDIKDFSEEHRYHLTRMHMKDEFHAVEEGEIEDDTLRKYYVLNADNEIKFDSEDYVKIRHDCQAKVA